VIPLVAPTITRRDRDYIAHSVYNGLLDNEREVRRFEEEFAAYVGCADAVAVCSGTAALRLASWEGNKLVVPTYACSAIYNATGDVALIDSHFNVRTATMQQSAPPLVNAIRVVVHAFGTRTMSGEREIEDWTLSLGGVDKLRGDIGVCSTHASKMISTGRGGLVFGNDQAMLDEVRDLAYYDQTPNGMIGSNSLGMTSLQAALGLVQLRQLPEFIARRREIAAAYSERFAAVGIECPDPDCGSVFYRYLIAVDDPAAKVAELALGGIEAGRGVYPPLHQQLGLPDDEFPGAMRAVNSLLSVPCYPALTDKQVRYIAEQVVEVCAP
jgi:perosamine synthetase